MLRLLVLLLLAGCGTSTKNYPTDSAGNVSVRAEVDRSVKTAVHVHTVDAKCATQYQGTVFLDSPSARISLPPGRPSLVVVVFDTSSFLRGSASTRTSTVITPRPGRKYDMLVRYRDALYEMQVREEGREIPRQDLQACRPA